MSATNSSDAARVIISNTPAAIRRLNEFARATFRTRGGRTGSGMGMVIEALWGFYLNGELAKDPNSACEMAWMYGHEYNDFACVLKDVDWNPDTRAGELLRVEVKSMIVSADESKAHFDRLQSELGDDEILAIFLWDWADVPSTAHSAPQIVDHFVDAALPVARLRDILHLVRGGSFVAPGECPDDCVRHHCTHVGEPLNSAGKRERLTGPESASPPRAPRAGNFGGLVRMLGARGAEAKDALRKAATKDDTSQHFVDFTARNFPRKRTSASTT